MAKAISPIPAGFHSLTTHLAVSGAAKYIDFLKNAFGAEEISRSPGPGGKLMHAEVRIGDSILMFSDDFGGEFGLPPLAQGRLPFHLHLYVPDADATWATAVAAGCEVTMPIADQFWRPLRARARSVRNELGHRHPQGRSHAGRTTGAFR